MGLFKCANLSCPARFKKSGGLTAGIFIKAKFYQELSNKQAQFFGEYLNDAMRLINRTFYALMRYDRLPGIPTFCLTEGVSNSFHHHLTKY